MSMKIIKKNLLILFVVFLYSCGQTQENGEGVKISGNAENLSASGFVHLERIDEEGIIRKVHYCKGLTDRLSMNYIHTFAEGKDADEAGIKKIERVW